MSVHPLNPNSTEPLRTTPRIEMDLHQANMLHRAMVAAYRKAQSNVEQARAAYYEAVNAKGDAYLALAQFEPYMAELEEHYGFRDIGRTDFVTLEKDETPEGDAG